MQPVTHQFLDNEQTIVHGQLYQAVQEINEADELLQKNPENAGAANSATALALSAIAKVFVVVSAERLGIVTRLPAFKNFRK